MSAMLNLSAVAMRGLALGACQAVGFSAGESAVEPVTRFLIERFVAQGQRLTRAVQRANDRAWDTLEFALPGESLWERCTGLFASADNKHFRQQVRTFLDNLPAGALDGAAPEFRRQALAELRTARQEGALRLGSLDIRLLAYQAGRFAGHANPAALLAAEKQALKEVAGLFTAERFAHLRRLLELTPADGPPLLTAAVRFFLRREIETDRELFQGLAFVLLEQQGETLERGFDSLAAALAEHEDRLRRLLEDAFVLSTDTYKEVRQLGEKLDQLLERHRLAGRELRPDDTLATISDDERRLVRELVKRYRELPEAHRAARIELAFKVGAAEAIAGDYAGARHDFETAACLAPDPRSQAEAHASAFQAALSAGEHDQALAALLSAARLDPARFAPFPLDKYAPKRILGAGGFGTAFLCGHSFRGDAVVVKALWAAGLGRSIDEVFNEARVLCRLSHPAIIQVYDCDFADPTRRANPFVVMEYFDGPSLASFVQAHGPFTPEAFLPIARQIAHGLQAAHERGVYHRDVKPANLLVRDGQIKLIDFGLALRPATLAVSRAYGQAPSPMGGSIAGTYRYAAPEQLGELTEPVGPTSDVYSFGRTCYFALLGTPMPDYEENESLPEPWKRLLSRCTARRPERRPGSFAEVLAELERLSEPAGSSRRGPQQPGGSPPLERPRPIRPKSVPCSRDTFGATPAVTLAGHTGTVSAVAFSPDSRALATGSFDDRARLWQLPEGTGGPWLTAHTADVNAVAFSPDGKLLATPSDDRLVRLWAVRTGKEQGRPLPHPDRVYSAAFHPSGAFLATGCDDGGVRLWVVSEGNLRNVFKGHTSFVRHVAFRPDGKALASGSGDRTSIVWDLAGKSRIVLAGHEHTVWCVAFSPDGRLVATASQDRTARLWNAADGRALATLSGHTDIVWSAAFSPDGQHLATASHDRTVKLWSVPDGRLLATLEGHTGLVRCVAFSPDGRYLATGSGDNTARIWLRHDAGEEVDWSGGAPALPPRPQVSVTLAGHGTVYPGDEVWLEVRVENAGRGDLVQLRAEVESDEPLLRTLGALFGRVRPGQLVSRCLGAVLPVDRLPGVLEGRLVFHEGNGYEPAAVPVAFTVRPFPRDDLPVSWRLADDGTGNSFGNGDGKPQRGECLDVIVTLDNQTGQALSGLRLSLTAIQVPAGVVVNVPRTELAELLEGGRAEARLTFSVKQTAATGPARFELRVEAADGRVFATVPVETAIE